MAASAQDIDVVTRIASEVMRPMFKEWRTEKIVMTETKLCADCKQAFPMNESGHLVVPFFDMHSTMCERCGTPLNIEYKEDGSIHFSCSFHHMVGSTSSRFSGHSPMYCPYCDEKRREKRR